MVRRHGDALRRGSLLWMGLLVGVGVLTTQVVLAAPAEREAAAPAPVALWKVELRSRDRHAEQARPVELRLALGYRGQEWDRSAGPVEALDPRERPLGLEQTRILLSVGGRW